MIVNRWPQVGGALRRRARQARREPGAVRGARAPHRADLRGPARGRRQRDRPLQARARGRSREPDRRSLARSPLSPDGALGGARGDPRARVRDSDRRPTRSSNTSTASGRCSSTGSATSTPRSRRYRDVLNAAPEHKATLEALEGLFAAQTQAGRDRRGPRAALSRRRRVGEARGRLRGAARAHRESGKAATSARPRITASRSSSRRSSSIRCRPSRSTSARSRSSRSTRSPAKRRRASPARSTAAGRPSPTPTPTSSASTTTRTSSARSGTSLAKTFEDELGDIDKAVETYRYVLSVEPLDIEALANLDRIYLSIESVGRARGHPRACASRHRPTTLELVELYARLGEVYETRLADIPNATVAFRRDLRRPRQDARTRHPGPRAHLQALGCVDGAQRGLRARARERVGRRRRRPRSAPSSRTSRPSGSTTRPAPIDTWKIVLDLRGEDPEALAALANLYERAAVVARARRHPRAPVRHRRDRRRSREHPHPSRSRLRGQARSATTSRSRTGTASSTSTSRTSPVSVRWRRSAVDRGLPGARHGPPPDGGSRRGDVRRRGAQGDLPRAR